MKIKEIQVHAGGGSSTPFSQTSTYRRLLGQYTRGR